MTQDYYDKMEAIEWVQKASYIGHDLAEVLYECRDIRIMTDEDIKKLATYAFHYAAKAMTLLGLENNYES